MRIFQTALAAAALLAVLSATTAAQTPTKWTQFQPPDGGYRVEFPGTPEVKRDTLPSRAGPAPHLEAKLSSGAYSYTVDLTTYAAASDPEAVLDLATANLATLGKLIAQTPLKVGRDAARRLQIEMKSGQVIATMLVVTDGTRVYQVSCVSLKGTEQSANVTHFINSFALVGN